MKKITKLFCLIALVLVLVSCTLTVVFVSANSNLEFDYTVSKTEYYVGEKVEIPTISPVCPDKVNEIVVSVKSPKGTQIDIVNNKFVVDEEGEYKVYIVAFGNLNAKYSEYYTITASTANFAVLTSEPYIPALYISGVEYSVPKAEFKDFNKKDNQVVSYSIEYINESGVSKKITGDKFTPSVSVSGAKIGLKYTAISSLNVTNTLTYEIPVNTARDLDEYNTPIFDYSKMFNNQGFATLSNKTNGMEIELTSPTKLDYANKINGSFKFELASSQGYNSLDNVRVVVTDSKDKDIQISLNLVKNADNQTTTLTINDKKSYVINGSINNFTDGVLVDFSNTTKYIKDNTSSSICKIENCLNGSSFDGFPSKTVYISFEILSVSATSKLRIVQINNHYFTDDPYDYISPYVVLTESIKTMYNEGEKAILPTAIAMDVLDANPQAFVTVRKDGKIVSGVDNQPIDCLTADTNYEFLATIGKYSIQYTAVDESGNEYTAGFYTVYVTDDICPELVLKGTINSIYNKGTAITIPSYSATDNNGDPTVLIYIVGPNMGYKVVKAGDTFTLTESGRYYIHYLAFDAYGNVASLDLMTESV